MAKKHFIYKITNTINGKIYIGKTSNIKRRWDEHLRIMHNKDTHLYNSMRKYGVDKFKIEIIETVTKSRIDEIEQYWIAKLNTIDPSIGYNIHEGGTGGDTYSNKTEFEKEEERRKRSERMHALYKTNPEYYEKIRRHLQSKSGKNNHTWSGYYYAQTPDGVLFKSITCREMASMIKINDGNLHLYLRRIPTKGKFKGWKFFKSKKNLI